MTTNKFTPKPITTPYQRLRDLPALIAMWPKEMQDFSPKGNLHVIEMIEKALRSERRRGKSNHWSYNLTRHIGLLKAWKAEKKHLKTSL